ncbi:MAG: hypothetical protein R2860_16220 [Desulfobacterales bacterium]
MGLENNGRQSKTHAIDVVMEDAAPQIRDERIKLTETFDTIQPEKEDHLLKWNFPLRPVKNRSLPMDSARSPG